MYSLGSTQVKSTVEQLFTIRQLLEKTREHDIKTHHLFINFKTAYKIVDKKTMLEFNISSHLKKLVQEMQTDVESCVKMLGIQMLTM